MNTILTFLIFLGGMYGAYLLISTLIARRGSDVAQLEVSGFQNKKDKGRALPIVRYEQDGEEQFIEVKSIHQISYLISPPIERQVIEISGVKGKSPAVFGYLYPVIGAALILPCLLALGMSMGRDFFVGQTIYVLIFIGVIFGGFALLKFIQRH